MWLALGAVVVGIILGIWMPYNLTPEMAPYLAIAIVAALDSVFGGVTAYMKKQFDKTIFFTGFFSNALLAAGLAYLGNVLGVNLMLAAIVIFGWRMFRNFAAMRYTALEKYRKRKEESVPLMSDEDFDDF